MAPADAETGQQGKILPFVAREPLEVHEEEGYEEGFTVIGPRHGVPGFHQPVPRQEPPATPQADDEERHPELPKDVRREFGDDEET